MLFSIHYTVGLKYDDIFPSMPGSYIRKGETNALVFFLIDDVGKVVYDFNDIIGAAP